MGNRLQNYPENQQIVRYQNQEQNRIMNGSPMVVGENNTMMVPQQQNISQIQNHQNHQQQHIIGPNGQVISVQGGLNSNQVNNGVVIQGQNGVPTQPHQHRVFINNQPNEPSGPGRPNIQMIPVGVTNQRDNQNRLHHFYNQSQYPQIQYDPSKQMRPTFLPGNNQMNGFRPQAMQAPVKMQWPNRIQNQAPNAYERVPPLHPHTPTPTMWQDEIKRKKVKLGKIVKRPYHMMDPAIHPPCPNIDVRQIPTENGRQVIINQNSASPSFMEDPSGYLAQQTALLNNTINRQTGRYFYF